MRLKRTTIGSAAILFTLSMTSMSSATIVSGLVTGGTAQSQGGIFIKLSPGFTQSDPDNTVGQNTFDTPNLYGFDESQNTTVLASEGPLAVDILASGGSGTLPVGTVVASHYVFFDPGPSTSQTGYVDFDADILAVVTSTSNLAASDYLANTGVTYLNPGARGLEPGDVVAIDGGNPQRLNVNWRASSPGDFVRVLTKFSPGATVPDGGSTALLGILAFGSLVGLRRWLRRGAN